MYLLYLKGTNEDPFEGPFVLLLSIATAIQNFMESFRKAFRKATTPIKMHLLGHHTLQWANRMHVGFGLLGEQGAKFYTCKVHFPALPIYNTMHDKVHKLLCIVKQHFLTPFGEYAALAATYQFQAVRFRVPWLKTPST